MQVLVGGFRGNTNSAKQIIDRIESKYSIEKLYLVNSFETSRDQLINKLTKNDYALVILFGQKPNVNSIYLECRACVNGNRLKTDDTYDRLAKMLVEKGFLPEISYNAGDYLCNHIYYHGLRYIQDNGLNTKIIFVHIPSVKNLKNPDGLANIFTNYIDEFLATKAFA